MPKGISYLGKHSYRDFGITMAPGREVGIPNKKKTKLAVPFSNVTYDYSSIFGSQTYEERTLKYTFNIANRTIRTKEDMNWLKTVLINWLMNSNGKQPLFDDVYPGVYFLAEIEGNSKFTENWTYGFLEVEFTAYPFMISVRPEGHDIWNDFNFLYDVVQETTFDVPASAANYKALSIGSPATIAAWAERTLGGTQGELSNWIGATGTVLSVQSVYEGNPYQSTRAYVVQGFDEPVLEQDIIQACNIYKDITLINTGTPAVFPKIKVTNPTDTAKLSVMNVSTGEVYNFVGSDPTNYLFQLKSGENNLRLYGLLDETVQFTFNRELI